MRRLIVRLNPPSSPVSVALWLAVALVVVIVLRQGALAARVFWIEWRDFTPHHWSVPAPADAASLGVVDVGFRSRDGTTLRGWITPSHNRALVILCAGSGSDRSTMVADARPLIHAGFGVLLFDWPGRGESDGIVRYGAPERDALAGALDFVVQRPDVDSSRIGAIGMSIGAYILTQVASEDRRLKAIALLGAMDGAISQARAEFQSAGPLARWAAILAMRTAGMPLHEMQPVDVIGRVAPRPVVIVAGERDRTVPPALSRRLFDAARAPKDFWLIPNAGHGGYEAADPTFGPRLADFFARTLTDRPPTTARSGPAGE